MIPSAAQAYFQTGRGQYRYVLLWVRGKRRDNGAIAETGLWTGQDTETLTVSGVQRVYYGGQGKLALPSGVTYEAGATVQMLPVEVGPLTPEVETMLRGHEPRQAAAEVHVRLYDDAHQHVATWPIFVGWVDDLQIAVEGGWDDVQTVATMTLASRSREGTRSLVATRSDALYRRRSGDRIAQYASAAGIRTPWGTDKV